MFKSNRKPKLLEKKVRVRHLVEFGKYKSKTLSWVAKNDYIFFQQIEKLYYPKYDLLKKQFYDRLKKQFSENNGLWTPPSFHTKVEEAVKLLKERQTFIQLFSHFQTKYSYNESIIRQILSDANLLINREFELEKEFLLDIHLLRYEEIFDDEMNPNVYHIQPGYRKAIISEHYQNAMEALFQKEKLLGIHTRGFKNALAKKQTLLDKRDRDFDFNKISFNEQVELFGLFKKAKSEIQLINPVLNTPKEDVSIKIEADVVVESPIKQAKQTDEIGEKEKNTIQKTGKTLIEVQMLIQQTLQEKIKALYDKKNNP